MRTSTLLSLFCVLPLILFSRVVELSERPFGNSVFFPQQEQLVIYKYDRALLTEHGFNIPVFPNLNANDTGMVFFRRSFLKNKDLQKDFACALIINYRSENPKLIISTETTTKEYSITGTSFVVEASRGVYVAINKNTGGRADPIFKSPFSGLKAVDEEYWLRYDLRNVLMTDVVFNTDSFRIGVVDINGDGIYNTVGTDAFIIAPYGRDTAYTLPLFNATFQKQTIHNYAQCGKCFYRIDRIAVDGRTLRLTKKSKTVTPFSIVHLFNYLPKAYVQLLDSAGNKTIINLRDYTNANPYTLIFFQDLTMPVFYTKFLDSLQQYTNQHPGVLSVIFINQINETSQLEDFKKSHPADWQYFVYDESLESDFLLWLWPCGYLFNTDKRLIAQVNIQSQISTLIK